MTDYTRNSPPHRSGIEHRITSLLVFSVTPFKINQNQNSSNDKVQNLEEKEGKYAKTFVKIQVTAMFLTQDMRKIFFTQIYRDFDGDAMPAPIRMAAGNQQKHLSLSFAAKA